MNIHHNTQLWSEVKWKSFSRVWLFATLWTIVCQAPLSVGFSKQEYWNGLPLLSPGAPPGPGIKPVFPALQVDSLPLSHQGRLARSALTKYHRLRGLNNRNTFLKVLGTKKFKIKALQRAASFSGLFSIFCTTSILLCVHMTSSLCTCMESKGEERWKEKGGRKKENTYTQA